MINNTVDIGSLLTPITVPKKTAQKNYLKCPYKENDVLPFPRHPVQRTKVFGEWST
jgi:hypothetical protein